MATAANVLKPDFTSHKKHFIFTAAGETRNASQALAVAEEGLSRTGGR